MKLNLLIDTFLDRCLMCLSLFHFPSVTLTIRENRYKIVHLFWYLHHSILPNMSRWCTICIRIPWTLEFAQANFKLHEKQTNFSCSFNYNSSVSFKLLCLSCIKFGNVYEHAESTQKVTTRRHSWNHPALIKSRPVNSCLKLHFVMAVLFRCQGRTAEARAQKISNHTKEK